MSLPMPLNKYSDDILSSRRLPYAMRLFIIQYGGVQKLREDIWGVYFEDEYRRHIEAGKPVRKAERRAQQLCQQILLEMAYDAECFDKKQWREKKGQNCTKVDESSKKEKVTTLTEKDMKDHGDSVQYIQGRFGNITRGTAIKTQHFVFCTPMSVVGLFAKIYTADAIEKPAVVVKMFATFTVMPLIFSFIEQPTLPKMFHLEDKANVSSCRGSLVLESQVLEGQRVYLLQAISPPTLYGDMLPLSSFCQTQPLSGVQRNWQTTFLQILYCWMQYTSMLSWQKETFVTNQPTTRGKYLCPSTNEMQHHVYKTLHGQFQFSSMLFFLATIWRAYLFDVSGIISVSIHRAPIRSITTEALALWNQGLVQTRHVNNHPVLLVDTHTPTTGKESGNVEEYTDDDRHRVEHDNDAENNENKPKTRKKASRAGVKRRLKKLFLRIIPCVKRSKKNK